MVPMNASADDTDDTAVQLRHVIVVGGTAGEWSATTDAQWSARLSELGKVADQVGANWLTLRPFDGRGALSAGPVRDEQVGGCRVEAQPITDGRQRVADAVNSLQQTGAIIDEHTLTAALNAPAEADPDLVVVLGTPELLPTSLVWELAYSELVFIDVPWPQLSAAQLEDAIESFAHRHRRFGGID
jgi:undecaprenyl diphosphate synthase